MYACMDDGMSVPHKFEDHILWPVLSNFFVDLRLNSFDVTVMKLKLIIPCEIMTCKSLSIPFQGINFIST